VKKLRIVLADDHEMFRQGIKSLIDQQPDLCIVGEAATGRAALEKVIELEPDLLVMDVSMPEMTGIQLAARLNRAAPAVRVLALTAFGDTAYVRQLLASGAAGYLLKSAAADELIEAIRIVARGGVYLDRAVAGKVVSGFVERKKQRGTRQGDLLSAREREVLCDVARGSRPGCRSASRPSSRTRPT
jgi:DNA-binding NarL/FixJ family response regulator